MRSTSALGLHPAGVDRAGPVVVSSGAVGLDDYRGLMSSFPTGVAVVTAVDSAGRPHGLTCTSLTSVTLSPPTLLVCLDLRSGTLAATRQTGLFAVNLLHERGRPAAEVFSSPVPDRYSQVAWRPSPWIRQPWLCEDAFALAECVVVDASVVGDHAVLYGEVVHVEQAPDVPLMYGMRRFGCWSAAPGSAASVTSVASGSVASGSVASGPPAERAVVEGMRA